LALREVWRDTSEHRRYILMYSVKEIFYTLQGEGDNTGTPAVFLRFAGCNLWSGRERHRRAAICRFCDTDFVGTDGPGGGNFAPQRNSRGLSQSNGHEQCRGGASSCALEASRSCSSIVR
jgi:hypothetical protein